MEASKLEGNLMETQKLWTYNKASQIGKEGRVLPMLIPVRWTGRRSRVF